MRRITEQKFYEVDAASDEKIRMALTSYEIGDKDTKNLVLAMKDLSNTLARTNGRENISRRTQPSSNVMYPRQNQSHSQSHDLKEEFEKLRAGESEGISITQVSNGAYDNLITRMRSSTFSVRNVHAHTDIVEPLLFGMNLIHKGDMEFKEEEKWENLLYQRRMISVLKGLRQDGQDTGMSVLLQLKQFMRQPLWYTLSQAATGMIKYTASSIFSIFFGRQKKAETIQEKIYKETKKQTEFMMTGQVDQTRGLFAEIRDSGIFGMAAKGVGSLLGIDRRTAQLRERQSAMGLPQQKGFFAEMSSRIYKDIVYEGRQGGLSKLHEKSQKVEVSNVEDIANSLATMHSLKATGVIIEGDYSEVKEDQKFLESQKSLELLNYNILRLNKISASHFDFSKIEMEREETILKSILSVNRNTNTQQISYSQSLNSGIYSIKHDIAEGLDHSKETAKEHTNILKDSKDNLDAIKKNSADQGKGRGFFGTLIAGLATLPAAITAMAATLVSAILASAAAIVSAITLSRSGTGRTPPVIVSDGKSKTSSKVGAGLIGGLVLYKLDDIFDVLSGGMSTKEEGFLEKVRVSFGNIKNKFGEVSDTTVQWFGTTTNLVAQSMEEYKNKISSIYDETTRGISDAFSVVGETVADVIGEPALGAAQRVLEPTKRGFGMWAEMFTGLGNEIYDVTVGSTVGLLSGRRLRDIVEQEPQISPEEQQARLQTTAESAAIFSLFGKGILSAPAAGVGVMGSALFGETDTWQKLFTLSKPLLRLDEALQRSDFTDSAINTTIDLLPEINQRIDQLRSDRSENLSVIDRIILANPITADAQINMERIIEGFQSNAPLVESRDSLRLIEQGNSQMIDLLSSINENIKMNMNMNPLEQLSLPEGGADSSIFNIYNGANN